MKNEIINLLKNEGKLSDNSIEEIQEINVNEFTDIIKEIGKQPTEYIKKEKIIKELNTKYIGKNLYIFHEVNSTNTLARFLAMNDIENGSVVISEKQNAAKGRSGKSWESPIGGVWLSIILNPNVDYSKLPLITLATGVAVAKTLEKIGVSKTEIKWPNDIMIYGKKVCGILTEAVTKFNTIKNVIIGVGIDANLDINDFPAELQDGTTTIEKELGKKEDEEILIRIFLEEFEKISELFNNEGFEEILNEWRKRSYTIGKIVEVREPFNKHYDGYVTGINKEGALIVEKIDGSLEKVISGECIVKN